MDYEAPAVEIMGPASALVQNRYGPFYDGDGYTLSQGFICSPVEEEQ